ncbi:hypothetical protein VMCG_10433 [Cytospora schulzeri]|uniref:Uncharacterized protein n=1 Tax=Cytospora schulzeri TaxID=448051 RepID=A0A423VB89_9PEZI|nr:hypothetical protein VMCG_10433 [Valsa malicola]
MTEEAKVQVVGRGSGHPASPLFARLPAEIRLKIYRDTFAGSVAALFLLPSMLNSDFLNTWKSRNTWIYNEALSLYWPGTLVRNGEEYHFRRDYLVKRVPDVAKNNISRIHGLSDTSCEERPYMHLEELLKHFPRLEACVIVDRMFQVNPPVCSRIGPQDPMWGQRCLEYDYWDIVAWGGSELVAPSHKAQVLQRWTYRLDTESLVAGNEMTLFHNYTTRRT